MNKDIRDFILKCDIDRIKVPYTFKITNPRTSKVLEKMGKMLRGEPIQPILVTFQGELLDGYIDYLVLKELGVKEVYIGFEDKTRKRNPFELLHRRLSFTTKDKELPLLKQGETRLIPRLIED